MNVNRCPTQQLLLQCFTPSCLLMFLSNLCNSRSVYMYLYNLHHVRLICISETFTGSGSHRLKSQKVNVLFFSNVIRSICVKYPWIITIRYVFFFLCSGLSQLNVFCSSSHHYTLWEFLFCCLHLSEIAVRTFRYLQVFHKSQFLQYFTFIQCLKWNRVNVELCFFFHFELKFLHRKRTTSPSLYMINCRDSYMFTSYRMSMARWPWLV